jgi:mono/diheme cytochrome c family protein
VIRIVNGGVNMPAFGKILTPDELAQITAFLQSRKYPMPAGLEAHERQSAAKAIPQADSQ